MRNIPRRNCTQGHAVLITAAPLGAGRFEAWCDGRLIVPYTREPLLAGARAAQTRDTPTAPAMPSFAWRLNDQQIADVLTYIRSNWGNQAAPVATDRVTAIRARLRSGS